MQKCPKPSKMVKKLLKLHNFVQKLVFSIMKPYIGMQSYFLPDLRCFWPQKLFLGVILGPKSSIIGSKNRVFARTFGAFSRKVLGIFWRNQNHQIREKKLYRPNLKFWPLTPPYSLNILITHSDNSGWNGSTLL